MKAARLEDGVLHIRDVPTSRFRATRRRWSASPRPGCATPISTSPAATGPGSRPTAPSVTKPSASSKHWAPARNEFVQVGDRVILGLGGTGGGYWCGACEYCLQGQPRHCAREQGHHRHLRRVLHACGRGSLVKIPDSIGDHEAPLACGGLTAYGAVKKLLAHRVLPGQPIAVIGAAGGLGHYAVQIATAFGYKVVGVDIGEERLDFVRSLGAHTRGRAPTTPSRWCSESSAASKPASCSRRGWRVSGSV